MNSSDAIARLFARGCAEERRHRLRIHIPIALSVIMAGMCIYSLYSWYPYFFVVGFLCVVAFVALFLKDAPPLGVSEQFIAEQLDIAFALRGRLTTLQSLEYTPTSETVLQRDLLRVQIQRQVAEKGDDKACVVPFLYEALEKRVRIVTVLACVSAFSFMFFRPTSRYQDDATHIASIIRKNPELPEPVRLKAQALVDALSNPRSDASDISAALATTEQALLQAMQVSKESRLDVVIAEGKGKAESQNLARSDSNMLPTPTVKTERKLGADSNSNENQEHDASKEDLQVPQQQNPKNGQGLEKSQAQSDNRQKDGDDDGAGQPESRQSENPSQSTNSEQPQSGNSRDRSKGAQGKKEKGLEQSESREKQRAGLSDKQEASSKEQGQEQGMGDGAGSGKAGSSDGEGQGDKQGSSGSQGAEGLSGSNQAQRQNNKSSPSADASSDQDSSAKGENSTRSGKGGAKGGSQDPMQQLQDAVSQVKDVLEKQKKGGKGDAQGQSKKESGDSADAAGENEKPDESKASEAGSSNGKERMQKQQQRDDSSQRGEKDVSQRGVESPKDGLKDQPAPTGERDAKRKQNRTSQEGESSSSGNVNRDMKPRDGGYDALRPSPDGLGVSGKFKEVFQEASDEKLNTEHAVGPGELKKNDERAKAQTILEDIQLSKPKPSKQRDDQPIPLEYKELLQ